MRTATWSCNLGCSVGALFAVVSDSYDLWNAIENIWCEGLLDQVKEYGSCVVIRPDSGTPHEVVLRALQILDRKVGCTENTKGFRLLPPHVRIIQGDGITSETIELILKTITDAHYSASNIAFGMGSGLLQQVNRDMAKMAMKTSWGLIDGQGVDIFKDPVTDPGKRSMRGRPEVIQRNGILQTVPGPIATGSQLDTIWETGEFKTRYSLGQMRARSDAALMELV